MVKLLAFARWEYPTCFLTLDVIPTRKHYGHYDESASFGLTSMFNCLTFQKLGEFKCRWTCHSKSGNKLRHLAYHTEKELRDAEPEEVEMKNRALCSTCYPPRLRFVVGRLISNLVGVRAL